MILKQFYLGCLAHASYLIGDEETGTAVVVDPQRDIGIYLSFAAEHKLQIKHVILTHLHADFVAGHLELRDEVGAKIYLGAKAQAEYKFTPLADGSTVEFGKVRLKALETPGHTPESISIEVFDLAKNAKEPYAVLTGDTLFVGDVGRPDLRAALGWSASDLGALLYDSIQNKILPLPDASLVYPAHGAGSLCGKAISKETVSTIGEQRRLNYALQPMSRQAFIELVTADQPEAPPYFVYDAVLNSKERATLDEALKQELKPLDLARVLELQAGGAQILDTREPEEFAAAHLTGSINIGLSGQYATWAGTILNCERPIVVIANPERESESAVRLGRIGFDNVAGFLKDGMRAVEGRPDLTKKSERISPALAAEILAGQGAPQLVDVRTPNERQQKLIEGSASVPLNRLEERAGELQKDRPVLVYCAGGYRSSIAASLLQKAGFEQVNEIAGGMAAWELAKLPVRTASAGRSI
jgi:glyoxylase-like metal-dependent hydrolase (beta-lactamase superfamily II)/rhodanese-related sulfurtransferase